MSLEAFIWDLFWGVGGKLIKFIGLYPKGLCPVLLKRTKEGKEHSTKVNFVEF